MSRGVIVPPPPLSAALRTGNDSIDLHPYSVTHPHIHRGVLIRRIMGSHLYTAVGGQQFCKKSRKLILIFNDIKTRIIFERYCSLFYYYLLSSRYVMLQKSILSKPKWGGGALAVVRGGTAPAAPPRSDGTAKRVDSASSNFFGWAGSVGSQ